MDTSYVSAKAIPSVELLLIISIPLLSAFVLAVSALKVPKRATAFIGTLSIFLSFVLSVILFAATYDSSTGHVATLYTFLHSDGFTVPFSLLEDHLSIFMALVVSGVSFLIHVYSVGYMNDEQPPSYARFFCYMNLFVASMLTLVLAANIVLLLIGWAMVGLCSYLLIGFWYERPSAVLAARKAFIMNVIGDIGLFVGAFLFFLYAHTIQMPGIFAWAVHHTSGSVTSILGPMPVGSFFNLVGFLLLLAASAKSAQIPLHTWLPDAMEGPTPVSALIHAATMVTAGVYLVARFNPVFDLASAAHAAVAAMGAATAIVAATIGLVQTDIKRVLAYSTMSQIGYMFVAVGVGAYAAGMFHLMTHAFFKALLFMAAGNVIHALNGEQDMRKMGQLANKLPKTYTAFLVGGLALAGLPIFAGFWSKEEILGQALGSGTALGTIVWAIGFITAGLTGLYTFRMIYLTFHGKKTESTPEHAHEAPAVMLTPTLILAALATVGGFIQITGLVPSGWAYIQYYLGPVVGPVTASFGTPQYISAAATFVLVLLGVLIAYVLYHEEREAKAIRERFKTVYTILVNKYYFDQIYDFAFRRLMDGFVFVAYRAIDLPIMNGSVVGVGSLTASFASKLSGAQTGYLRNYMLVLVLGAIVVSIIALVR